MKTVAVVTALVAALLFGISSVADQRSTKLVKTERALSPAILLDLVKQPLWLMAIVTNLAAFALQVTALSLGSLAVVQPLLVFDLVFAVLIGRSVLWDPSKFPEGAKRWDPLLLAGVAARHARRGRISSPSGSRRPGTRTLASAFLVPLAVGLVVLVGGCLAVAARTRICGRSRWRLAAASLRGRRLLGQAGDDGIRRRAGQGVHQLPIYVLAITGPVGYLLNQDAFQQGRFLHPSRRSSLPPIPSSPSRSASCGWAPGCRTAPPRSTGVVLSLLLMTAWIVITARQAPQAPRTQASAAPCEGPVG